MAPKTATPEPHIANVGKALEAHAKRQPAPGKMVTLTATQRGFYGRPMARLVEPGTRFEFAVKDLEQPHQLKSENASDREAVTIDGVAYVLPTWCTATVPDAVPDESPDEDDGASDDDNVI